MTKLSLFRKWGFAAFMIAAILALPASGALAETTDVAAVEPEASVETIAPVESFVASIADSEEKEEVTDEKKSEDVVVSDVTEAAASDAFDIVEVVEEPATGPWYVANDGHDEKYDCLSAETPCETIAGAMDKASDGQTVIVAAGEYAEHVTVSKSLTLQGANSSMSCLATRGDESVITGSASGAVSITADGVVFSGFQVTSAVNNLGTGIWMSGDTENVVMSNNLVTGNQIGIFAAGSSNEISCNSIDGNNEPGAAGGAGIYSESTSDLTVDGNEFVNHTQNNPIIFAATSAGAHTGLTVSDNDFDNTYGIYVLSVDGGSFTGNDITTGNFATAISFGGGVNDVTVTQNVIRENFNGVRVRDDGAGFGNSSNININRNAIVDNGGDDLTGFGVLNASGYDGTLDATCNWWNAIDGPNPDGHGDLVSDNVSFSDWLTSTDLDGTCGGDPEEGNNDGRSGSSGGSRRNSDDDGQVLGVSTTVDTASSTTASTTAPVEKFVFMVDLRIGMRSSEVMELQKRLRAEGYFTFPTDTGYFGPITLAAVKAYQAANGVPATGFCGPLTRAALNK